MPGIGQSGVSPVPQSGSLGVIISLPEVLAQELSARRADYGGAEAAVVPPHITLVSGAASGEWEEAAEHVRRVAAAGEPFTISLRGVGSFEPISPVVFLTVTEGAQNCVELHQALLEGPLDHLLDFEFHPHLTIAHDLDADTMNRAKAELSAFAADFKVNSIGLFDYLAGAWALREELALGGGQ